MITSAFDGIVFANTNDSLLNELTALRSMASVPFGGRYRLVDFALSNLVNAGISNIGIITKENYNSLMDHLGSGVYWDLDRKNGGLFIIPPYFTSDTRKYSGTVDALIGAENYLNRCTSDYIILHNSDLVANVDISSAIEFHLGSGADITIVYNNGKMPAANSKVMVMEFGDDGRANRISFDYEGTDNVNYDLGISIMRRDLLISLVKEAYENDGKGIKADIFAKKLGSLKIYGYEHKGYAAVMDGTNSYFKANMDLLNSSVRSDLFNKQRSVLTKTRDDMPTRYGTKSKVKNSFVAEGCVIDGTVINSVLFRGVKVKKGAVVENCILMQETSVGENSKIKYVISDKNVSIGTDIVLNGTENNLLNVEKDRIL